MPLECVGVRRITPTLIHTLARTTEAWPRQEKKTLPPQFQTDAGHIFLIKLSYKHKKKK